MKGEIAKAGVRAVKRSVPLLFAGVAAVGVVGSIVLAVRAGKKIQKEVAFEPDPEWDKKKRFIEEAKVTWKYYIPVVICGSVTIVSIILSHKLSAKQLAAMTAACGYITSNRDKLERELKKAVGEEEFKKIKSKITEETVKEHYIRSAGPSVEDTGKGDDHFINTWNGREFRHAYAAVESAIRKIKSDFTDGHCCVTMADFDEYLGLFRTRQDEYWGYPYIDDEQFRYLEEIDISIQHVPKGQWESSDGTVLDEDVYLIIFDTPPEPDPYETACM